jgi:hypothetical protein
VAEAAARLAANSARTLKRRPFIIGAAHAGQRAAIIYTLIEACRRRGLDPFVYLRDVLTRLPAATTGQIKDLTPEAWAKRQRNAGLQDAAWRSEVATSDAYAPAGVGCWSRNDSSYTPVGPIGSTLIAPILLWISGKAASNGGRKDGPEETVSIPLRPSAGREKPRR